MSILRKSTPDEAKMILIDLNSNELSKYSGVPHLACPPISDAKAALGALFYLYSELDHRTELFTQSTSPPPRVIIILNEFSGLMTDAGLWFIQLIKAIGKKGRAAGIHLVIATGSINRDVISDLLKSCIPARLASSVPGEQHSRIILDRTGAERLEDGEALYSPTYSSKPVKVQGAYVSNSEIVRITDFMQKNNDMPVFDEALMRFIELASKASWPDSVYGYLKDKIGDLGFPELADARFEDDEDFVDDEDLGKECEDKDGGWAVDW